MERGHRALAILVALTVASCAVGQAVKQRKKAIAATKGAEITGGLEQPIRYTGRVRVYASAEYRAKRTNWRTDIRNLIEATGNVLGPSFGLVLEVEGAVDWDPACDLEDLRACLEELMQHDPAPDVDWVLGLVGSVPKFSASYDFLGMGRMPGRHLVMRDLYTEGEREAIREAFPAMTGAKRNEIYRERQKHKRMVVFLHELGHTLGGLHTRREGVILYPAYSDKTAGFSDANARLIDASLKDRFPFDPTYPNLSEFVSAHDEQEWRDGDRDQLLSALAVVGANVRPPGSTKGTQAVLPGDEDALLAGVSPEDRQRYAEAHDQFEAGDVEASWATLAPLIDRYPDSQAVQHFGCTVAMHVGERETAGKACRRAIELAGE